MNYYSYSRQLCDIIIVAEDTPFHTHREVLWDLSPYFRTLFSRWSRADQVLFTIPGVAPNMMKSIIQYAYSKRIRITLKNVQDLLVAADYLLVTDIVQLCCQYLEKRLRPENCVEVWRFASMHSLNNMSEQALLVLQQSLPYHLSVPSAYSNLQSALLNMGESSARCRPKPYTRSQRKKKN